MSADAHDTLASKIKPAPTPSADLAPAAPFDFERVHLVGVGGCGMSGLAHAFLASGLEVSGTDRCWNTPCQRLADAGARIHEGHCADRVPDSGVVVYSTAVPDDNVELARARERGLRILHRSEALALFLSTRQSVLVTGAHGKTTTSAMLTLAFEGAGLDPWGFIGGFVPAYSGNTRAGGLAWAVSEADESDGAFERLPADHLIVLNIEDDHLDYWKTGDALRAGYLRVARAVAPGGTVLVCLDNPEASALRRQLDRRVLSYSVREGAGDYSAANIRLDPFSSRFDWRRADGHTVPVELGAPGYQNISNAVGALALLDAVGGDVRAGAAALAAFRGVGRRFEIKGRVAGITVIDDYAHHPTEIAATLDAARAAARSTGGRLVAAFQPHRFTRTRDQLAHFAASFAGCDALVLTEVYAAGEEPIEGATAEALAARIERTGVHHLELIRDRAEIAPSLAPRLHAGDVFITLGAGDITRTSDEIVEILRCFEDPVGDLS